MKEIFLAGGIVSFIAVAEYLLSQKKPLANYVFWFFVVLGSMYMTKAYCDEVPFFHELEPANSQTSDPNDLSFDRVAERLALIDSIIQGNYSDISVTYEEAVLCATEFQKICAKIYEQVCSDSLYNHCAHRFVPPGTPDNFINKDGTLSDVVLKQIQATNDVLAYNSLSLHKEKAEKYYLEARDMCWYLPNLSERDKAKMAFTTVLAMLPGPITHKVIAAIIAMAGQYGLSCIDEWHDIEFKMNMSRYHYMVADAFQKHINNKNW